MGHVTLRFSGFSDSVYELAKRLPPPDALYDEGEPTRRSRRDRSRIFYRSGLPDSETTLASCNSLLSRFRGQEDALVELSTRATEDVVCCVYYDPNSDEDIVELPRQFLVLMKRLGATVDVIAWLYGDEDTRLAELPSERREGQT